MVVFELHCAALQRGKGNMGINLWQHYIHEAKRIESEAFVSVASLENWQAVREQRAREFLCSIGLENTDRVCELDVRFFGEFKRTGYRAQKIAFQILPDCWTTATYYLPDPLPERKLPAVLYTCGHGRPTGILSYHPHAAMWARRGYAALVFDTIEQHDAGGDHHGTYFGRRYDWISMGYSGATGELWNSLRALDVLEGMPEVDPARIGATGISGGGAHSFFVTVADARIKAVASCCGVTMPRSSIEDRHLQGHCDCMYIINKFQRCTSEFAALIAPRPLFFGYASEDLLFARSEYLALAEQTRRIYRLYQAEDDFRFFEYPGQHGYQPETVTAINEWFDRHVAGEEHPPGQLGDFEVDERDITIFNGCPAASNKMSLIPELLSPVGSLELPVTPEEWPDIRRKAVTRLKQDVLSLLDHSKARFEAELLGDWMESKPMPGMQPVRRMAWRGTIAGMDVWITALIRPMDAGRALVAWCAPDEHAAQLLLRFYETTQAASIVVIEGRTAGWSAYPDCMKWDALRGGALVGLSPCLLMLQDMKLVLAFLKEQPFLQDHKIFLYGRGDAGVAALYQAALDETLAGVVAEAAPASHRDGAYLPGILRVMDLDHAAGLVGPRPVALINQAPGRQYWASRLYQRLGCSERYIKSACPHRALMKVFEYGC